MAKNPFRAAKVVPCSERRGSSAAASRPMSLTEAGRDAPNVATTHYMYHLRAQIPPCTRTRRTVRHIVTSGAPDVTRKGSYSARRLSQEPTVFVERAEDGYRLLVEHVW